MARVTEEATQPRGTGQRQGTASHLRRSAALVALLVLAGVAPAQMTSFGRGTRAPESLNRALEMQRRGELERAAELLQQAQSQSASLNVTERQELARLLETNRAALASRKQARELLAQTEAALTEGQTAAAREMCRRLVSLEQSLLPADRARLAQTCRTLGVAPGGQGSAVLARTRVQQARAMLQQGNLDAAERLAREAGSLTREFSTSEDRPVRVLEDVERARRDPKVLLTASRAALQRNELDEAEKLAAAAEERASTFTFPLWGDSPSKAQKDIQTARAKQNIRPGSETADVLEPSRTAQQQLQDRSKPAASGGIFAPVKNLFGRGKPEKKAEPAKTEPKEVQHAVARTSVPEKKDAQVQPAKPENGSRGSVLRVFGKEMQEPARTEKTPAATIAKSDSPAIKQAATTQASTFAQLPQGVANPPAPKPVPAPVGAWKNAPRSVAPPVGVRSSVQTGPTEKARQLVVAGRKALGQGDLATATSYAERARDLKPDLAYWEDNPERLLRAVQHRKENTTSATQQQADEEPVALEPEKKPKGQPRKVERTASKPTTPGPRTTAEVQSLLRDGRRQLAAGNYDDVSQAITQARGYSGRYGLFEDTPEKLQNDLVKARAKRDKEESGRALRDARKAYQAGEYEKAQTLAFKAEQLHGPYTILEFGDRPGKLLDEIAAAKQRKFAVAQNTAPEVKKSDAIAVKPVEKTENVAKVEKTVKVEKPQPPVVPQQRQIALQLMLEAQQLKSAGKLGEARQKLLEAEALKAPFRSDEPSPTSMQMQLASQASQRSGVLAQRAVELVSFGPEQPVQNCARAEAQLQEAKQLATAFELDVKPIEQKLAWVAQMKARLASPPGAATVAQGTPGAPVEKTPAAPPAGTKVETTARTRGLELLEKSRLELRKGSLRLARTLAEKAFGDEYGVKTEAQQRLREIDIEEHNQARLQTRNEFDAGLIAFNQKNYFHAREILTAVKPADLDERRQARLREVMASPEMGTEEVAVKPDLANEKPPIARVDDRTGGPKVAQPGTLANVEGAGRSTAADDFEGDLLKTTKAMQNVRFQEMTQESLKVQRESGDRFRQGDAYGAVALLQDFLLKLPQSHLDGEKMGMIRRPIESRMQKYQLMAAQTDIDRQAAGGKPIKASEVMIGKALSEANKQKHVAQLMKQFNESYRQGKYQQAEQYARLVQEIDPDNPVATAAVTVAKRSGRLQETKDLKKQTEERNYQLIKDSEDMGDATTIRKPITFDAKTTERTRGRKNISIKEIGLRKSAAVREIESKLEMPVILNFTDTPLHKAIEDLGAWQGINIQPDRAAMRNANISLERPVSLRVERISLKSALNILLKQVDLTWVIRDDILQVTTKEEAKEKLVQRVYQVTDLVIPVPDYTLPDVLNFNKQLERSMDLQNGSAVNRSSGGSGSLPGGTQVQGSMGSTSQGAGTPFATQGGGQAGPGTSPGNGSGQLELTKAGPSNAVPQHLINLICNAIAPDSWAPTASGPGTIDYFPLAMTLVINQTPDIQEQIADLLQQLRRLQDQSVALEIRLISLSDNFFERMGVDFDLKIKTDRNTARFEPQLTSGQFKPPGFINDPNFSKFIAGLTPAGTFTRDLDIPLSATSFPIATPPFGYAREFAAGATGGMNLGLAFLSDIQVFFFLEAAQGDQRFNIMQAPKMTLFNGQTATLTVQNNQFFVTGVRPDLTIPGNPVFFPIVQAFSPGVTINLQAVITGDRRFVRINIGNIQLVNLISPTINLFPVTIPVRPVFDGIGAVGDPTLLTMFLQQPAFNSVFMQTTVVVPDGGTVLIGGLKRLSEGRNEFGPPILSKIPYLNRLVKNVGYGRESENIMLMVTPRIIITEEEEILQTGVISNPALVQ